MPGIFYFLDYDGTLAPMTPNPANTRLPAKARRLLINLAAEKDVKVAIVTGRSYRDAYSKIKLPQLFYATNHGMDIYYKGKRILLKGRKFMKPLAEVCAAIKGGLADIPKAIVQEKELSLSIHYQPVAKRLRPAVIERIERIFKEHSNRSDLSIHGGKMFVEIRPAKFWHKGDGLLWLWKRYAPGYVPFFVGDDVTDEDAFRAIRKKGITLRVGYKKDSFANYFLSRPLY